MPLGRQLISQYRPKKIKLSEIYKYLTNSSTMASQIKQDVREALKKSGYNKNQISSIIDYNRSLTVEQMKEIARHLHRERVFGFNDRNPQYLVDHFLRKEMIKRHNLDRLKKKESIAARRESIINDKNQTTKKQKINLQF